MPLELPDKFKADISSKQISIVTRVIIGEGDSAKYISTHSINFEGNYYNPILLDSPSIKHSLDYDSRKFKTSTLNLKLSNYEFNGERFSDTLKDNPLINKEVNVYLNSQSTSDSSESLLLFSGYAARVQHTDSTVNILLEDLTQFKMNKKLPSKKTSNSKAMIEKYKNVPIPIVYGNLKTAPTVLDIGNILKADSDSSVSIVTNGQGDYLTTGVDWPYESHPVWGEYLEWGNKGVSPLQVDLDGTIGYIPIKNLESLEDSELSTFSTEGHTQWDGVNVLQEGTVKLSPEIQATGINGKDYATLQAIIPFKSDNIECHFRRNTLGLSAHNDSNDYGWSTPNRFDEEIINIASDDDYSATPIEESIGYNPDNTYTGDGLHYMFAHPTSTNYPVGYDINQSLAKISINSIPGVDYSGISDFAQLSINKFLFPKMPSTLSGSVESRLYMVANDNESSENVSEWNDGSFYSIDSFGDIEHPMLSLSDSFSSMGWTEINNKPKNLFQFEHHLGDNEETNYYTGYPNPFDDDFNYNDNTIICYAYLNDSYTATSHRIHENSYVKLEQNANTMDLDFGIRISIPAYNEGVFNHIDEMHMAIKGNINEVDIVNLVDFKYNPKANFFLNVTGRLGEILSTSGSSTYIAPIVNPIQIMKSIAVEELGLDESQIDEDSYESSLFQHNFTDNGVQIKFAFSVNEEIEGKKLLEDIAKSTLCYPYFDNNGNLHFPSFKEDYDFELDYGTARLIKESDVISFSFDKTKQENIYSSVIFKYNYNYVSKKYDSILDSDLYPSDNELIYNGHIDFDGEPDHKANVLTFNSKYIVDEQTAISARKKIFRFHKHQHLLCKIKMPLNYIDIMVGDIIRFDKLLGGLKSFGIDYTKLVLIAGEYQYGGVALPLFFVTSVNLKVNSIEIEGLQINNLGEPTGFPESLLDYDLEEMADEEDGVADPTICPNDYEWDELTQACVYVGGGLQGPSDFQETLDFTIENPVWKFTLWDNSNSTEFEHIAHWFEPQAFGLTSFDELVPTNWDSFSPSEVAAYTVLIIDIKHRIVDGSGVMYSRFTLKNLVPQNGWGGDPNNFNLGWDYTSHDQTGNIIPTYTHLWDNHQFELENADSSTMIINTEPHWTDVEGNTQVYNVWHRIYIGQGTLKAMQDSLLDLSDTGYPDNHAKITFTPGLDISAANPSQSEFSLGDVNQDLNLSILDIVMMVNGTLGSYTWEGSQASLADVNQDGSVSILDIVQIMHIIMGTD